MSATALLAPGIRFAPPTLASARESLIPAGANLWRVQSRHSRIIGHLRMAHTERGVRFRAERLQLATGTFRLVGEFWSPDDAVAALRG